MRLATLSLFLAVLVFALPSRGGAEPLAKEEIEQLAAPLIEGKWAKGMVIGWIDADGSHVIGLGHTTDDNSAAPTGDTLFEIGSVTKAFTGVLLADMVTRGEVALDDPAQKHLPDAVKLPKIGDTPITLAHLSSHTSGLPRMPGNFAPADPDNPYADYTTDRLYAFLNACKPKRAPGESYEYSNLGTGLLGQALAHEKGTAYEALLAERIFKPTGMTDTYFALGDGAKARLAQGHNADGEAAKNWDLNSLAAAGGIRSTANDLLKFVAANMDAENPLAEAMTLSRKPLAKAMPNNEIGLGWHLSQGNTVAWHNGQTGGYHSFVAFIPEKKVGVVVLSNTSGSMIDALGNQLLKRLSGKNASPVQLPKTVTLAPEALEAAVGRYILTPIFALTITREGDRLFCQATNQPRVRIYPKSETEFYYRVADASLTLKLNKAGKAFMITLHQNGLNLPGLRAEPTEPADTKPAASTNSPAAGR